MHESYITTGHIVREVKSQVLTQISIPFGVYIMVSIRNLINWIYKMGKKLNFFRFLTHHSKCVYIFYQ